MKYRSHVHELSITFNSETEHRNSPPLTIWQCLLVWQCINFKAATLVHRSLSGNTTSYLADVCCLVTKARLRRPRSADTGTFLFS